MSNDDNVYNIFNKLFGSSPIYSESDIISMYIDGKINKEEYLRMMDSRRNR